MKKLKYWTHIKISVEFHDCLMTSEYFQKYPKLIPPSLTFMNLVNSFQMMNDADEVEVYCKLIENNFANYIKETRSNELEANKGENLNGNNLNKISPIYIDNLLRKYKLTPKQVESLINPYYTYKGDICYTTAVDELVKLGLITRTKDFTIGDSLRGIEGHCRLYSVTHKGQQLLLSPNLEYFKKLQGQDVRRKIQKSVSKRKLNYMKFDDPLLQHLFNILLNLDYDFAEVDKLMSQERLQIEALESQNDFEAAEKVYRGLNHALCLLSDIRARSYERKTKNKDKYLFKNEADLRIWYHIVGLSSKYRILLKLKGYKYAAVLDQRASHPSLLGKFVEDYAASEPDGKFDRSLLYDEIQRYTAFFNAPNSNDPRHDIARELDLPPKLIKRGLLIFINGGRWVDLEDEAWLSENEIAILTKTIVLKIENWFRTHYPQMFAVLEPVLKTKTIGNYITAHYETKIFQDYSLYELGDRLGLKICYEYDGIGVFAKNDETDLPAKLEKLKQHIEAQSKALLGFSIYVDVENLTDASTPTE